MSVVVSSDSSVSDHNRSPGHRDGGATIECVRCGLQIHGSLTKKARRHAGGHAHNACFFALARATKRAKQRAAVDAASALIELQPSLTAESGPAKSPIVAAAAASSCSISAPRPPPLLDLSLTPAECFTRYGYALLRADDVARALAADVLRLPLVGAKRDPIAGDVTQYDLASVLPRALQTQWHAVMRAAATTVGISDASELSIQAEKLLSAAPGKGEQALHFDRDDEADRLRRVFSCILYCSHGAHSTAVPRFAPGDFALPVYDDSEAVLNATELRATVERGLWEDEAYHQCNVAPGDVMIFSQAVPHRGTRNPLALAPRICLFSIVTPFAEPKQDDFQVYRWMYIAAAYGFASRELAAAVHRDRAHRPLDRFSADAKGAEAREAYVTNLLRWSCIAYHPDTRRVEWLQDVGVEPQSEEAVLVAYTGRSASVRARAVKRSSGKM